MAGYKEGYRIAMDMEQANKAMDMIGHYPTFKIVFGVILIIVVGVIAYIFEKGG
jgi:TctA family transporter